MWLSWLLAGLMALCESLAVLEQGLGTTVLLLPLINALLLLWLLLWLLLTELGGPGDRLGVVMGVTKALDVSTSPFVGLLKISPAGTTNCEDELENTTEDAGIVMVVPWSTCPVMGPVPAGSWLGAVAPALDTLPAVVLGVGGGSCAALGGSSANIKKYNDYYK